jgi:hypothetical protein
MSAMSAAEFVSDVFRLVWTLESRGLANRAAHPPATCRAPTAAEIAARDEAARCRAIRAICPAEIRGIGEECVKDGLGIEASRRRMLAEWDKRHPKLEDVPVEEFQRGLFGG